MVRPDSIIPGLPEGEIRVVGVFQRSVSVTVENGLLNLHREAGAITPAGIWAPDLDPTMLTPGTTGTFSWPTLRLVAIPPLALVESLELSPPSLRSGMPSLHNLETLRKALKLFARSSEVTRALWKDVPGGDDRSGSDVIPRAITGIRRRLTEENLDLAEFEPCFGGGEGLTPAFDDFCTGLLLADVRVAGRGDGRRKVQVRSGVIDRLAGRTTLASAWQLRFAAEGRSSLTIERFLDRYFSESVSTAEVLQVMNLGHSSGSDILSGIWCRLQHP